MGIKKYVLAASLLASAGFADVDDAYFAPMSYGNIPMSTGTVTNVFIVTASTVVTVTVPAGANQAIFGGDNLFICENPSRCGTTFPSATVSSTGWLYNPQGRILAGDCRTSPTTMYAYARELPSTGTAIGVFEWSNNGMCR